MHYLISKILQLDTKFPVISAWMQKSSTRDGDLRKAISLETGEMLSQAFTSMRTDTGIHASMTVLAEVPC